MKKRHDFLILCFLFFLIINGCSIDRNKYPEMVPTILKKNAATNGIVESPNTSATTLPEQSASLSSGISLPPKPVNSIGNTLNNGYFAVEDGILYHQFFCEEDGKYYLSKWDADGRMTQLLAENPWTSRKVSNICVYEGRIYFRADSKVSRFSENLGTGQIYSICIDGSELMALTEEPTDIFYIYGGYIYYMSTYERMYTSETNTEETRGKIYKMSLDGQNRELQYSCAGDAGENEMYFFSIYENKLYFRAGVKEIMSIDLESNKIFDISKGLKSSNIQVVSNIIPEENGIYFLARAIQQDVYDDEVLSTVFEEGDYLLCMGFDGNTISIVLEDPTAYTIADGWIYYAKYKNQGAEIRRKNCVNGEDMQVIELNNAVHHLEVVETDIFFESQEEDGAIYSVPIDGSREPIRVE